MRAHTIRRTDATIHPDVGAVFRHSHQHPTNNKHTSTSLTCNIAYIDIAYAYVHTDINCISDYRQISAKSIVVSSRRARARTTDARKQRRNRTQPYLTRARICACAVSGDPVGALSIRRARVSGASACARANRPRSCARAYPHRHIRSSLRAYCGDARIYPNHPAYPATYRRTVTGGVDKLSVVNSHDAAHACRHIQCISGCVDIQADKLNFLRRHARRAVAWRCASGEHAHIHSGCNSPHNPLSINCVSIHDLY